MTDGTSYYEHQAKARGIKTADDSRKESLFEGAVFDRLILPHLPALGDGAIYEAACGPGILQCWLSQRGFTDLEGSDFSLHEATLAASINPRIHHGDSLAHLKTFGPGHFRAIIALDFYEHLPRELFRHFLAIASESLKPGGVLIMRGPNGDSPFVGLNLYNDITHVWTYTTVAMRSLLALEGMTSVCFDDDTDKALHHGRWWKRPLMHVSRQILTGLTFAATRQKIHYWGMSLYIYARK
jgi:2-polyprenyl-3-methyl-5-hydroxy-6-metoxy-1,4-benzoquinol methylase